MVCKKGGTLPTPIWVSAIQKRRFIDYTYFCPASMSKYFKSRSVCSGVFMLTNVVAMPVFPLRPVRPI